jgi:hypothetical protein
MKRTRLQLLGYFASLLCIAPAAAAVSASASAQGATDTDTGTDTELRCVVGWGSNEVRVIQPDKINDGYCDCPLDGADETNTDACSGIDAWPGASIHMANDDDSVMYVFCFVLFCLLCS